MWLLEQCNLLFQIKLTRGKVTLAFANVLVFCSIFMAMMNSLENFKLYFNCKDMLPGVRYSDLKQCVQDNFIIISKLILTTFLWTGAMLLSILILEVWLLSKEEECSPAYTACQLRSGAQGSLLLFWRYCFSFSSKINSLSNCKSEHVAYFALWTAARRIQCVL